MRNSLKKLLICGTSLIMVTSLSAGINNVSAKRGHHYRPRTHRVTSSRSLYKQGERDSDNYASENTVSPKTARKIYKQIINKLIKTHFNRSYIKGLSPIDPNKGGGFAGESNDLDVSVLSDAKKVMRQRSRKMNRKLINRHAKKVNKKTTRKNKKAHKVSRTSNGSYYSKGKQSGEKSFNLITNGQLKLNKHQIDNHIRSLVYGSRSSSKSWRNGFKAGMKSAFNTYVRKNDETKIRDAYDHPNSEVAKDTGIKDCKAFVSYMTNYDAHHSKSMTARALVKHMNKRMAIEDAWANKEESEENEGNDEDN